MKKCRFAEQELWGNLPSMSTKNQPHDNGRGKKGTHHFMHWLHPWHTSWNSLQSKPSKASSYHRIYHIGRGCAGRCLGDAELVLLMRRADF